jgi:hypothetical protein
LLTDIENTHPQGKDTRQTDGDLESVFSRCEGGIEDFGEDLTLSERKKLYAAHNDREKNKSYPNII